MHAKHIFLPRSDRAGAAHFAQLHLAGAHVREVVVYRTVCSETLDPASVAAAADADAILFFSPSAVHAFVALVDHGVLPPIADSTGIGAIGPVTKENLLKEAKLRCDFEADEPTIEKIIAALTAFFEKGRATSAGAPAR
jgi:Uroporphyrinogen-III synthase